MNFSYALEIVFQNSPVWFILSFGRMRVGSAHSSRGPLGGGAVLGLPRCAAPRLRKLHSGLCWRGLWPCGPWWGVWGGVGGCGGGGRGRGFDTTFACFLAAAAGLPGFGLCVGGGGGWALRCVSDLRFS